MRADQLAEARAKYKFDLNESGNVRLLQNCDRSSKLKSYYNTTYNQNRPLIAQTMNGLSDHRDLIHLQVKGKNQLYKEIDEIHKLPVKVIDSKALKSHDPDEEIFAIHYDW